MVWFVVRDPDGESCSHPQPLDGVDAVKAVAFVADTVRVCVLPLVAPNVRDELLSVRLPVPPPPVPPLTTTTTGTVRLLAAPLALMTILPELTPLDRDEGFRCTMKFAGVTVLLPATVIQLADGVTVIASAELSLAVTDRVESLQPVPPDWKLHATVPVRLLTVAFTTVPV